MAAGKKYPVFSLNEGKIADLNQQAADIEEVESALLPVLDTTLNRLDILVRSGLPMSLDHRLETIARTRRILDDYDAGLPAKTRAVLDTLSREVDWGHTVEVQEQEIETGDGTRQVKLLRVGCLDLFAVTLDNRTGFAWDRSGRRFLPLEKSARNLVQAVEMAEGIRLISLTPLPLDLPPARTVDTGLQENRLKTVTRQTEESMRNVIKHRFPRILAMAVLVPCLLAGFVQAASTRDFPSVARAVDADHAAAIQARVATEKKIQKKRAAMARQIQNLETMLSWARQEQAAEEARLTDLSARRDALKKRSPPGFPGKRNWK